MAQIPARIEADCFNPRPRVGGDCASSRIGREQAGFNPRPRVGGDPRYRPQSGQDDVSIRAPAWGATSGHDTQPAQGHQFQSAPPRGGRLVHFEESDWGKPVSIRAPAWGATRGPWKVRKDENGFNPRPRVGGDVNRCAIDVHISGFNPRPRVGGDGAIAHLGSGPARFQSAPPRGGRLHFAGYFVVDLEFQSAPPRGGRRGSRWQVRTPKTRFNPRPRVGGDFVDFGPVR